MTGLLFAFLLPTTVGAQPACPFFADEPAALDAWLDDLESGAHYRIVLRHTEKGAPVERDDCSDPQLGLTETGRADAQAVGTALTSLLGSQLRVLSSSYCRTLQTAELAFPEVEVEREDGLRNDKAMDRWLLHALMEASAGPEHHVYVTHFTNIGAMRWQGGSVVGDLAAADESQGIVLIFDSEGGSPPTPVGCVLPGHWPAVSERLNERRAERADASER